MRKSLAAAMVAACAVALAGCNRPNDDGGPTVSRSYNVSNFHEIEAAGPYDVTIHTGGNAAVSASGGEKLLDKTVVEVRGDKLLIHPEEQHGFFHMGWSGRGHAKFTVTVPQLTAGVIAGSGDMTIDRVQGSGFEGTVAGSGGLSIGQANVQALKLSIAGSGNARAAGQAQSADYEIAGSGGVDTAAVQTQQAKISIAGSGSVKAHASQTADVSIMGSGDVNVTGGAKCSVSKAGSGDVHCS